MLNGDVPVIGSYFNMLTAAITAFTDKIFEVQDTKKFWKGYLSFKVYVHNKIDETVAINLTFYGPCVVVYLNNKDQKDALFLS
jgi:hypothetical protein